MAAIVVICSGHGLRIKGHYRHQTKLWPLLLFNYHLKQLYISDKTEQFSYRGGAVYMGIACLTRLLKEQLAYTTDS